MNVNIGEVTHFYSHLCVATVLLNGELRLGDTLVFLGYTTDFPQLVCSIEVEHKRLTSAQSGMTVAIKVDEPVREGDQVFKLVEGAQDPQNKLIWKQMGQAIEAIFPLYQPIFTEFQHRNGLDNHAIGILLAAIELEPGMISPESLQIHGPYTSATIYMARLQQAAGKGFLVEPGPGEFRLSPFGREKIQKLISDARAAMQRADPLPADDCLRLGNLLARLVQASLFTTPPPETWSIRLAYQLMPDTDAPLPFVEQTIACMMAYRDDAHLAAWQPSGLSAAAIETLTLLWRGEAATSEQIYDRLAYRGFQFHDYQAVVKELNQRGFVQGKTDLLQLTQAGKDFRDRVEFETERYFFTPWAELEPVEKAELACLLSTLLRSLNAKSTAYDVS